MIPSAINVGALVFRRLEEDKFPPLYELPIRGEHPDWGVFHIGHAITGLPLIVRLDDLPGEDGSVFYLSDMSARQIADAVFDKLEGGRET